MKIFLFSQFICGNSELFISQINSDVNYINYLEFGKKNSFVNKYILKALIYLK